jgi:hypothetical protein
MITPEQPPLVLPHDLAVQLHQLLGQLLGAAGDVDDTVTPAAIEPYRPAYPQSRTDAGPTAELVSVLQDVISRFVPAVNAASGNVTGYMLNFPYAVEVEAFKWWCASLEAARHVHMIPTPPPPGNTREKLPDHILRMLARRMYLSTACEMAQACESAVLRYPDNSEELAYWGNWLHEKRCRLNNKFSDAPCCCPCHKDAAEAAR